MSESNNQASGPAYWKSLDQKVDSPEFQEWLHREFPEGASEWSGVNRRHFLKLMAASFSLAGVGLTGCRQPRQHILPYARQPETVIQGVPSFYSTAYPASWGHVPLIVESHQGRPTKIEGNPSDSRTGGATDAFTQASVLNLYDPDRLRQSSRGTRRLPRAALLDYLTQLSRSIRTRSGQGVAFLARPSSSPSRARLIRDLQEAAPDVLWCEYDPLENISLEQTSQKLAGKSMRAVYHLDKAKRVLCLDSDFMGLEPDSVANSAAFAKTRKVRKAEDADKMSRLYSVESNLSLTGAAADHRLRLSACEIDRFVARIAWMICDAQGVRHTLLSALREYSEPVSRYDAWARACVSDLLEHRESSVVRVGAHLSSSSQVLSVLINEALGAVGSLVEYLDVTRPYRCADIEQLAAKVKDGSIQTLVLIEGNPVYDAPADLELGLFIKTVPEVVRFGSYDDESAMGAAVKIAASHYLESWSDGLTYEGRYVPVQPLVEPLYATLSELEFLARVTGASTTDPYRTVRATAATVDGGLESNPGFSGFLAEGVTKETLYAPVASSDLNTLFASLGDMLENAPLLVAPAADSLELRMVPSFHTYDGSYANNGWMMECPDPLTKLTWDNAILISPKLAKDLESSTDLSIFANTSLLNELGFLQRNSAIFSRGMQEAPVARITLNGVTLEGPAHVQPGLADYTVVVAKGMGRTIGRIGTGVGVDIYPFTKNDEPCVRQQLKLELTGDYYPLANTQEHWSMEGRAIIREGSVADFKSDPDFVNKMGMESHSPPIYGVDRDQPMEYKAVKTPRGGGLYEPPNFEFRDRFHPTDPNATWAPQQWGMSIDLNTCTGCNACVIACQSENNIPIVGKDQVMRGREMHWIRLDRYFSSAEAEKTDIPGDVQVSFQGMACVHCELAPCETVCPVNATVHDEQGLNVMAYNRCVGTRYCANNCPYKVRRFNFFDWNKRQIGKYYMGPLGPVDDPEVLKMQRNPDVTVRMRGVMEKCSYCVQRIEAAKIRQKSIAGASDNVRVPDGTIKTACQQVCPPQAIVFGDITDTGSEVYREKHSELDYSVLGYLNIRPRTTYLARIRNPNPKMPERYSYTTPFTRQDYKSKSPGGGYGAESQPVMSETHS